ncbi:protein adenylyltransferase SelO [Desulfotalea psychrophila]
MNFSNSYRQLGSDFYEESLPTPVLAPRLLLWNAPLAEQLMIPEELGQAALAQIFSGNQLLPGSEPIAMAYAGHQFGSFVPQLGDGRAHLLGEVFDKSGQRWDIQLKGSGPTQFSRGGDGRCAVGPALREFIMSEAMYALGVPTSRCLAVVTSGEDVYRRSILPGAIVTRIASSHLRVGTFEFFAARGEHEALKRLCDYTIDRHFPELQGATDQYIRFLDRVIGRQIQLITEWMRVGFIHGVMNTDNTSLAGETIDYGPCAMLGAYDPHTVYSSIDIKKRYAFGNQSAISQWNMTRLAECLLPLINADRNRAIDQLNPLLIAYTDRFNRVYIKMMGKKLGLTSLQAKDEKLIISLLDQLKIGKMDYTLTFDLLTKSLSSEPIASQMRGQLGNYFDLWQRRLKEQGTDLQEVQTLMRQQNPLLIPRNHHIEAAIAECEQTGRVNLAEKLLHVLRAPYEELTETHLYQDPPSDGDKNYQTFCGT